jgi:hypothetical protein
VHNPKLLMKHLALCFVLVLIGFGCVGTSPSPLVNDFQPTQGKATSTKEKDGSTEGPFERRLMTAVSQDGLTYTQTRNWITDQANVPDMVMDDNGVIYLYYSGWIVGDRLNVSAVAISQDMGETWTYHYVDVEETINLASPVDPDVVLLEDGTFRLFFTSGGSDGKVGIHYADGVDGITFTYKGPVFIPKEGTAIDSTTQKIGDTWHMWILSNKGLGAIWHLTSNNGTAFSLYDITSFPFDGRNQMVSNGVWVDDKFHLSLFNPTVGTIVSMWTKNGFDWYPSEGVQLSPGQDELYVKDPAILELSDGQYFMVYVTNTPE